MECSVVSSLEQVDLCLFYKWFRKSDEIRVIWVVDVTITPFRILGQKIFESSSFSVASSEVDTRSILLGHNV